MSRTGQSAETGSQDGRARFEDLVARYSGHVYAIAYRMSGNHADAQDLVQEAFLRAWKALPGIRRDVPLEGWFYRTVTNLFIDQLRRRHGVRLYSMDDPIQTSSGEIGREFPDEGAEVERAVAGAEVDSRVQDALLSLNPEVRMVIVLADVDGYAYEEIASMMGIPIGTVKSRLHRARAAMRDRLEPIREELKVQ